MKALGSRLKESVRYPTTAIDTTFPWVVSDALVAAKIIKAARALQRARVMYRDSQGMSLRDQAKLLRDCEALPNCTDPLYLAKKGLDAIVLAAYGLPAHATEDEVLTRLLALNESIAGPVFPPNADETSDHVWLKGVPVDELLK